jgi:hypothetical protein
MTGGEVVKLARRFDNLFNAGIAKFYDIARIHVDQVIVLHAMVGFLKLGDVLSKLVLYNQAAIEQ